MYANKLCLLPVLLLISCIFSVYGKGISSLFNYCKISDSNRDDCLKRTVKDAVSILVNVADKYNIPSVEPIKIESASIGKGSGPVNVVQNYKNIQFHNFAREISVDDVKSVIEPNHFKFDVKVSSPHVILEADYNFNGRILVLPIIGDGKCEIRLDNFTSDVTFEGNTFEKNKKTYARVISSKFSFNPGKVTYKFENLFNGDERLSTEMHNVLNDNWKDVFEDVKHGYEQLLSTVFIATANRVFSHIEYKTVFPN